MNALRGRLTFKRDYELLCADAQANREILSFLFKRLLLVPRKLKSKIEFLEKKNKKNWDFIFVHNLPSPKVRMCRVRRRQPVRVLWWFLGRRSTSPRSICRAGCPVARRWVPAPAAQEEIFQFPPTSWVIITLKGLRPVGILTSLAALGSDTHENVISHIDTTSAGVRPNLAPSWMNRSHWWAEGGCDCLVNRSINPSIVSLGAIEHSSQCEWEGLTVTRGTSYLFCRAVPHCDNMAHFQ